MRPVPEGNDDDKGSAGEASAEPLVKIILLPGQTRGRCVILLHNHSLVRPRDLGEYEEVGCPQFQLAQLPGDAWEVTRLLLWKCIVRPQPQLAASHTCAFGQRS